MFIKNLHIAIKKYTFNCVLNILKVNRFFKEYGRLFQYFIVWLFLWSTICWYVDMCRPDLIEYNKLTKANPTYNLNNAFNVAEDRLGLTRLLDPEGWLLQPSMAHMLWTSSRPCRHRCWSTVGAPLTSYCAAFCWWLIVTTWLTWHVLFGSIDWAWYFCCLTFEFDLFWYSSFHWSFT